ncbi:tetratricopeptide repeat protein [Streptomyces sp. URMC 123]|uniref:tetratricopeptide repeat protein n=1 Tax=Streptomyces sp. URMC 123 TaxID=3423403 RepID=UPI003F1C3D39
MTEQAVQTAQPSTAARHPSPRPPAPAAHAFVGRARELEELRADIARTGLDTLSGRKAARGRVLLIAGRPGSGRTALAEEFVRRRVAAGEYPDGVLRGRLTEPGGRPVPIGRIARDLLGALGVAAPPGADDDELTAALRAALAGRRALLLLEDAADAEQVDALIPDEPRCLVLVTSGGPLTGIPDVRPCTLGGLDVRAAVAFLTRYAGDTRITCDPRAAEALVEECAAQPAALALAGGWLAARPKASVADLARRLRDRPPRIAPEGPLLRVFELVHESMPQPAARLLRLLTLAPAGHVDAHIASALAGCSVSAAQTALDDFVRQGLLRPVPTERAAPLYRLPGCLAPLLRGPLAELERPAEVQLARARMLERTVRQLRSCWATTEPVGSPARKKLAGLPRALRFASAGAAAQWLDSRLPALLAAARLAVEDGDLDTLARRLVAALARALTAHRGAEAAAPELYPLHQLVLDVAERRNLHLERAAALLNLADLDAGAGRTREALPRYRAALDAARAAADPLLTGRALESLGGGYQELGDWQRSADWYGRALSLRLSRGELADEARLYGRLGAVQGQAGRWGEALRSWRAAAAAYRRLRDARGYARALAETARVQEYAGRPEDSLRTCREALACARAARDERLEAAVQLRLADALDRLHDGAAARLHRSAAQRLLAQLRREAGDETVGSVGAVCPVGAGAPGETPETGEECGANPSSAYEIRSS